MKIRSQRLVSIVSSVILLTGILAGCAKNNTEKAVAVTEDLNGGEAYSISIMLPSLLPDPVVDDSPVKKALESYTNTKIKLVWTPSTAYDDKLNIALASGDLPNMVEVSSKSASILSAVKAGAFWEVGPYLKNYTNLSKANATVLNNTSISGKIYGIYRSRPYGRSGIIYRKDWADTLGIKEPKTIDEFYNMLKAFTTQDPDQNGKNDTYGMSVTKTLGSFGVTLAWFGAPNQWGEDTNGKLVYAATTNEYLDCLKFWRKLYSEGLINKDFPVFESDAPKWRDTMITGKAGVIVTGVDDAQKIETGLLTANPKTVVGAIDVFGEVSGPKGLKNVPTSGYAGTFMFPKSSNKTEKDIKRVLAFVDKTNDKQGQILINNGLEGRQYTIKDGYRVVSTNKDILPNETSNLAQLGTGVIDDLTIPLKPTALATKIAAVMKDNEQYCVPNPAEPLISATYGTQGAQLDNILESAKVKFIVGQIDEAGFKSALELWKKSGGDKVTTEINDEYAKVKTK